MNCNEERKEKAAPNLMQAYYLAFTCTNWKTLQTNSYTGYRFQSPEFRTTRILSNNTKKFLVHPVTGALLLSIYSIISSKKHDSSIVLK
jgi:hypothetical protein